MSASEPTPDALIGCSDVAIIAMTGLIAIQGQDLGTE
jgi:hypothetical protein